MILLLGQRAGDAADPELHAAPHLRRHLAPDHDVGHGEAAAGLEHAERLARAPVRLSAERLMTQLEMITSTELSGSGIASISPFRNSTFSTPALRWFSRARASISSVMSRPYALPGGPDAPGREEHVDAAAGAQVQHRLALAKLGQRGRVAAAERGEHRLLRQRGRLGRAVEVGGDGVLG